MKEINESRKANSESEIKQLSKRVKNLEEGLASIKEYILNKKDNFIQNTSSQKGKFYAVTVGWRTGLFTKWEGHDGAEAQVKKYSGGKCRMFTTRKEAEEYLAEYQEY
jgi:hypothetical protein